MYFRNRREAGRLLVRRLSQYKNQKDVIVLALPRGGVPVAYELARELGAPLDIFIVRKLGVPGHEELAMGAIASGGVRILHEGIMLEFGIRADILDEVSRREQAEIARREELYRGTRPAPSVEGRTVIVVDDGVATGSTMKAALAAIREQHPSRLIVAVPTAPAETCAELQNTADEVVCATTPNPFFAVEGSYEDFTQTTDEEVRELLRRKT